MNTIHYIILFTLAGGGAVLLVGLLFKYLRRYGAYAYANARVNAKKSNLFKDDALGSLIQIQDLQGLVGTLSDSHYSPSLESVAEPTPENVEISLQKHLFVSHKRITALAPEEIREIFTSMKKIHEIRNIKTLLVDKYVGAPPEETKDKLLPPISISSEVYSRAVEAENMRGVSAAFEETEYGDLIEEQLSEYEDTGKILPLWFGIEQRHWQNVWKIARDSDAKHSEIIQQAIGMRVDIHNILTIFRCKSEQVSSEEIEKYIVPIYSELKEQNLERAMESEGVSEAVTSLEDTFYGDALSNALSEFEETQSIFALERALEEFLLQKLRTLSIQYYTGVGPLLTFFFEKDIEVRNVTSIINGKVEGLKSEEIKEKLVIPEVER